MRVNSLQNRTALGQSYVRQSEISEGLPVYLAVESTSICNLKCIMCPYPSMGRKNEHMKMTVYEKLIAEAAGSVEFIWLHLFGEPLLNPNIYKMIDMAEDAGICTGISTNATRLDEKASGALLDSRLSILLLCVDGATKATFEHIRVGAKFDVVRDNITRFGEMKRARKTKMKATVQMIHMTENEGERELFQQQWRDKGFDAVLYKGFNPWANQDEKLVHIGSRPSAPPAGLCWEPWIGCTILADGRVVPCCNDYAAKIPLGDLKTQSLAEIWNGPLMRELRRRFLGSPGLAGTICENCPYPVANPAEGEIGEGPFNPVEEQMGAYVTRCEDMPRLEPHDPYIVRTTVKPPASAIKAGHAFACEVRMANRSPWTLRTKGSTPIHLSYHWLDTDGACVVHDGARTRLAPELPGGSEHTYTAQVIAPASAGRYVLQVSLVQEQVGWFDAWDVDNSGFCVVDVT